MARTNSSSQCVAGMSRPHARLRCGNGPRCGPQSKPNRPFRTARLVEVARSVGHIGDLPGVGFGEMKGESRPNELVALARRLSQSSPVEDRDLAASTGDQSGTLELPGGVADRGPLDAKHVAQE